MAMRPEQQATTASMFALFVCSGVGMFGARNVFRCFMREPTQPICDPTLWGV